MSVAPTSITDWIWLLTISLGKALALTTGDRQKEKRWQLVGPILKSSHGGGRKDVGMLGEGVQHVDIDIARHEIPDQLNFSLMVWKGSEGWRVKKRGGGGNEV